VESSHALAAAPARGSRRSPCPAVTLPIGNRTELRRAIEAIEAQRRELNVVLASLRSALSSDDAPVPVNLKTAAAISRHSDETVRLWAVNNRLAGARKVGGRWQINLPELLGFLRSRGAR
jgi:hypothetical protein